MYCTVYTAAFLGPDGQGIVEFIVIPVITMQKLFFRNVPTKYKHKDEQLVPTGIPHYMTLLCTLTKAKYGKNLLYVLYNTICTYYSHSWALLLLKVASVKH